EQRRSRRPQGGVRPLGVDEPLERVGHHGQVEDHWSPYAWPWPKRRPSPRLSRGGGSRRAGRAGPAEAAGGSSVTSIVPMLRAGADGGAEGAAPPPGAPLARLTGGVSWAGSAAG